MSIESFLKSIKPNVLYGFLPTPIVGIKHASGSKNLKESTCLKIVREPENQYDKNACRIDTKENIKVGYISALFAEKICPIIDRKHEFESVEVECITLSTPQEYDITGALVFFGPEKLKETSISSIRNLIPSYLDGGTWFSENNKKRKLVDNMEDIPKKAKRSAGWCKSFKRDTEQLTAMNSARTVITPVKILTKNDDFQNIRFHLNKLLQEFVNACQDESNSLKTGMRLKLETLMQKFVTHKKKWNKEDHALSTSYLKAITK